MGNNEDPQTLHKYAYANCDPVNMVDPSGREGSLIETALVTGIITGLITAVIVGIDSALGGKDAKGIAFDAATGFLIGFSVGALAVLIGPMALARIAPYIPYLLLLLGGWGAYDSFSHGLIAQGIFRVIVTVLSVGLASPAARVKIQQFGRFLWGKIFPAGSFPVPTFAGSPPPSQGWRRILYNPLTKQIFIGSEQAGTHAQVAIEAGWTSDEIGNVLVGGHAQFENGVAKSIIWASGWFNGTPALVEEAAAAGGLANAPAILVPPTGSPPPDK